MLKQAAMLPQENFPKLQQDISEGEEKRELYLLQYFFRVNTSILWLQIVVFGFLLKLERETTAWCIIKTG